MDEYGRDEGRLGFPALRYLGLTAGRKRRIGYPKFLWVFARGPGQTPLSLLVLFLLGGLGVLGRMVRGKMSGSDLALHAV